MEFANLGGFPPGRWGPLSLHGKLEPGGTKVADQSQKEPGMPGEEETVADQQHANGTVDFHTF